MYLSIFCRFCDVFFWCNILCRSRALKVCNVGFLGVLGGFWEVVTLFRLFWRVHTLACKFSRPWIWFSSGSHGCCSSSYPIGDVDELYGLLYLGKVNLCFWICVIWLLSSDCGWCLIFVVHFLGLRDTCDGPWYVCMIVFRLIICIDYLGFWRGDFVYVKDMLYKILKNVPLLLTTLVDIFQIWCLVFFPNMLSILVLGVVNL